MNLICVPAEWLIGPYQALRRLRADAKRRYDSGIEEFDRVDLDTWESVHAVWHIARVASDGYSENYNLKMIYERADNVWHNFSTALVHAQCGEALAAYEWYSSAVENAKDLARYLAQYNA